MDTVMADSIPCTLHWYHILDFHNVVINYEHCVCFSTARIS